MNPLSNRFNRGHPKGKAKDLKDTADTVLSPPSTSSSQKENAPRLPPLRGFPPLYEQPQPSIGTPTSSTSTASFEALSESEIASLFLPPTGDTAEYTTTSTTYSGVPLSDFSVENSTATTFAIDIASPRVDKVLAEQSSQESGNGDVSTTDGNNGVLKNVDFISPALTSTPSSLGLDHPSANDASATSKSTAVYSPPIHPTDLGGSTSTSAPTSRTDVGSSENDVSTITRRWRPPSPHPIKLSHGDKVSIHQSLRSGTPLSQSGSLLPPASWSEGAEEDLVTHLGPRERARQEVLWEIVASEERYVAELIKMKETFIIPLLHPFATASSIASPTMLEYDDMSLLESPTESLEHLPIASRFLSPTGFRSDTCTTLNHTSRYKGAPNIDCESLNSDSEDNNDILGRGFQESRRGGQGNLNPSKHNHPRSPYGTPQNTSVPFPSRSHLSLPSPPLRDLNAVSTQSFGRENLIKTDLIANGDVGHIAPHQIPDDLRQCLEIVEDSILAGHLKFSEDLRKRYDEQYPLVRSLADVFVAHSHIFRCYVDYILHLEQALQQASDAISTTNETKRKKKKDTDKRLIGFKISALLRKLEMDAEDRCETGLVISLSKPFQRLLKYPMLFQALLFHTDPSMFEYESTLRVAAEVENIIRDIEDAKNQKEERDKTRDVLVRIKGLDKVKQFAVPKPSRVLVEEVILDLRESSDASRASKPPVGITRAVGRKTSFKLSSDILRSGGGGIGSQKDVWLVVFNDVALRCQRTGITTLPLGAAHSSMANSVSGLGKSKYATTGRRDSSVRPRNVYRFIKIENWAIGDVNQTREGVVAMEDVVRSRAQVYSAIQPRITPIPEVDEDRSVDSDELERNEEEMTFSHWSTDNVSLQKPLAESHLGPEEYGSRQTESPWPSLYPGSSLANAVFGSRLVSENSIFSGSRPSSRPTVTTPSLRSLAVVSEEGYSVRTSTRLGPGEHSWGQVEPTAPFLYSGESFANAKFGGRLVTFNPLLSRGRSLGRSPSRRTIVSDEQH